MKCAVDVFLEPLDETKEDTMICYTCNETKPVSYFYVESSSKRTKWYQRRGQCVCCWSTLKGKKRPTTSGAKLFYYEVI